MDLAGVAVDAGAGIAAGLAAGFADDLPLGPGLTTVFAAAQDAGLLDDAAGINTEFVTWGDVLRLSPDPRASVAAMNGMLHFYEGPAAEAGWDRFRAAYTSAGRTAADCASGAFNASAVPVRGLWPDAQAGPRTGLWGPPIEHVAYVYDCVVALAAALAAAPDVADGADVYERFKRVSFEGASGHVAFDHATGDREVGATYQFMLTRYGAGTVRVSWVGVVRVARLLLLYYSTAVLAIRDRASPSRAVRATRSAPRRARVGRRHCVRTVSAHRRSDDRTRGN